MIVGLVAAVAVGGCEHGADGAGGSGEASGIGADGGGQDADGSQGCHTTCATPTPFCLSGTCVGCVTSADCATPTTPVCNTSTNTCIACASDSQCVDKFGPDPGVCMAHQDGRCATVTETIYVQNDTALCSDTSAASDPGAGTVGKPLCSMEPLRAFLSTRDVVVVRGPLVQGGSWSYAGEAGAELSIIGQSGATVGNASAQAAFGMQSGAVYLRGVKIASSASLGIKAAGGSVRTEQVVVDSCAGGGISLDGAAFDLENTTVTRNGPGTQGTSGGIMVNALPASGTAKLRLLTVENNIGPGVSCASAVQGDGVLATGNTPVQIASLCAFSSCSSQSATCGAQ